MPDYFAAVVRHGATNRRFGVAIDPFRFPQLPEFIGRAGFAGRHIAESSEIEAARQTIDVDGLWQDLIARHLLVL